MDKAILDASRKAISIKFSAVVVISDDMPSNDGNMPESARNLSSRLKTKAAVGVE